MEVMLAAEEELLEVALGKADAHEAPPDPAASQEGEFETLADSDVWLRLGLPSSAPVEAEETGEAERQEEAEEVGDAAAQNEESTRESTETMAKLAGRFRWGVQQKKVRTRRGGEGKAVGLMGQIQMMKFMSEEAVAERARNALPEEDEDDDDDDDDDDDVLDPALAILARAEAGGARRSRRGAAPMPSLTTGGILPMACLAAQAADDFPMPFSDRPAST